ncbi:MBL fold metallo-hydrolase [Paenibacillus sp. PR3]|uniref:MBL fold metallo-hydrolase n=1 Tax=Paenibacillus terricola TaxID=2763503 RepID=A0ABR8N1Z0_9BACL|nr:MBL fold metallo-hydrolase [Paenibacillus terricola]MBD3922196.1 MBL fold metallo-hydrolase [Paenibacillus terricola]
MDNWNRSRRGNNGKFQNEIPVFVKYSVGVTVSMLREFLSAKTQRRPKQPLPIVPIQRGTLSDRKDKIFWFGHSAALLQIGGKTILLDPMLGKNPSPFPFSRNRRFSVKLPITIEELPPIDIVVLSHDHFDHLDSSSIRKLIPKAGTFLVPLGVGKRIQKRGASPDTVIELDWGEERIVQGIRFTCTPARHFSGRGLFDQNSTLWCSWVIKTEKRSLFYSGDGGYGPHFKRIGRQHGPFELALMECGQYIECGQYYKRWSGVHMLPEETVQAHRDVQGGVLLPVHWGGFTLALHDWNEPPRRLSAAAEEQCMPYHIPRIGEAVYLDQIPLSSQHDYWWRDPGSGTD